MARRQQAYDLNRQVRLLDIHKQFMGGLKTIDTDDALGSVFLRDVDNLSISEYGFLEKRYGTYISEEFQFEEQVNLLAFIQGYFEYVDDEGGVHKLLFLDGDAWLKMPGETTYKKIEKFHTEEGFDYPDKSLIIAETQWTPIAISENVTSSFGLSFMPTIIAPTQILTSKIKNFGGLSLSYIISQFENIKVPDSVKDFGLSYTIAINDSENFSQSFDVNLGGLDFSYTISQFENVLAPLLHYESGLDYSYNIIKAENQAFDLGTLTEDSGLDYAYTIVKFEEEPPEPTPTPTPTPTPEPEPTPTTLPGCLHEDTPIVMADGTTRLAKDVKVGDMLKGWYKDGMVDESDPDWVDWTTNSIEDGLHTHVEVKSAYPASYDMYYTINDDIRITPFHTLLVKKDNTWQWLDAPDIEVGNFLLGMNNNPIEITNITSHKETMKVMKIDVESVDTYFAGETPVLVHNEGSKEPF